MKFDSTALDRFKGIQVSGGDDRSIKKFMRKLREQGVDREVRLRSSYMKPSIKKRMKRARAAHIRSLES